MHLQVSKPVLAIGIFAIAATSAPRQDRAWKTYFNRRIGYCVSYPTHWIRSDAFDGAGIAISTGIKRFSLPVGSMDVSALPEPDLPLLVATSLGPASDVEVHLNELQKFGRASDVTILEKRSFDLSGTPGLFLKLHYFDPQERKRWVEEIIFTHRNGMSYRLELESRADQLDRFDAVFARFVNSFQMQCTGRR